ncbi:large ribosomal subunit protein mL52 isoform X2 [Eulemur rufifrons]|uniref:large ribosomal subunit protein mL52 isoform X2 n=1 Tax=Eulemur rufifrons TaxID=859984 RepID=UPI0037434321
MAALGTVLSSVRRLHRSAAAWAGSQWRLQQGLAANPSGYGPLTELPDWSYADGRPAPPMKGQLRRKAEREKFARRVVLLSQEMDAGLQAWQLRQQEKLQEEERKQKNALKPKGASLRHPLPSQ